MSGHETRASRPCGVGATSPGGYWIAKDDPRVASEALTGSVPARNLAGAALLSNGASRIVDPYGLAEWPEVLNLLRTSAPSEIISQVRKTEADHSRGGPLDPTPPDDATVAYCRQRRAGK